MANAVQKAPFRTFESRVSNRFVYKPRQPIASGSDLPNPKLRLRAAASAVAEKAAKEPTLENLRHLGISYMLLGNAEKALETLTAALRQATGVAAPMKAIPRCTDAALLNTLAAACEMRFSGGEAGDFKAMALEATQAAWRLQKTPEIAWTRAVIVDSLHLRECSRDAWRDYLALEPASLWSSEAQIRLNTLSQPTEADLWPAVRDRLTSSPVETDARVLAGTVGQFSQQVRLWCEDELLPAWGNSILRGEKIASQRLLLISLLGRSLSSATGEEGVARATDAILEAPENVRKKLARGHVEYGAARKALLAGDATVAARSFESSIAELDSSASIFALRARAEHAAAIYGLNDYPRALAAFERLLADKAPEQSGSNALHGRLQWGVGLLNLQMGHPAAAKDHYKVALEAFERAREKDYQAALHSLLADVQETLGNPAEAERHRNAALQLLEKTGNVQRRHGVIFEAAYAAILNDQPALADLLLDRVVAHDRAQGSAVTACTSLMWRSAHRARRARVSEAESDLRLAHSACSSIPDPAARERALANLAVAQAILGGQGDQQPDPRELDRAISYYSHTESRVWLQTSYMARARARTRAGRFTEAETDYLRAIAESAVSRNDIDDRDLRMSFTATADEVVDAYVEFLLARGRAVEAFEAADRNRARELVSSPSAQWRVAPRKTGIADVQSALPDDATLIEYRVLESRIVAWLVRSNTFETLTVPIDIAEVEYLVSSFNQDRPGRRREAATSLYNALVRRLPIQPAQSGSLIIVPDDELERVPFVALYDDVQGQYLGERHATSILPSAALIGPSRVRLAERTTSQERVLVLSADKSGHGMPALPGAAAEAREIAALFPGTRIIMENTPSSSALSLVHDATLIHFAGHTIAPREHGTARALLLGDQAGSIASTSVLSGRLSRVRIAYLSACDTDAGEILKAEGSVTIARSFFAAGVPVVVATLWPVEDEVAREMARLFYRELRQGQEPAEALRSAQMTLAHNENGSHADWAAYRLIGAGFRRVSLSERRGKKP